MSNKTNEEKLRILQERLAQIKQKEASNNIFQKIQKEKKIENAMLDSKHNHKKNRSFFSSWNFRILLLFSFVIFVMYLNKKSITENQNNPALADISSESLIYDLNMQGDNIAIIGTFENENSAKAVVNDLTTKGFLVDYFFLPNKSNSNQEVYKVFIGPYENKKETNQWIENIDKEIHIINNIDGSLSRHIKSSSQIQKEKERIEQEKLEQERIEQEKLEQERIEQENLEKERIEIEKIDKERIEIEKIDKERVIEERTKRDDQISIKYNYNFTLTSEKNGFIIITNNAKYPRIKQFYTEIDEKGGVSSIVKEAKFIMEKEGVTFNKISFAKTGSIVPFYKGTVTTVTLNK
jgi:hypothetical protein